MTGYGPALPTTSGGVGALGLAWGASSQNFLVIGVGLLAIGMTLYFHVRLRQGEAELEKQQEEE